MTRPMRPSEEKLTPSMRRALRRALELEKGVQGEPWVAGRYRRTAVACARRGLAEEYRVTDTPGAQVFYRITPAGREAVAFQGRPPAHREHQRSTVRGSSSVVGEAS